MMGRNRAKSIISPALTFRKYGIRLETGKGRAVIAATGMQAYGISEKPWAPPLFRLYDDRGYYSGKVAVD